MVYFLKRFSESVPTRKILFFLSSTSRGFFCVLPQVGMRVNVPKIADISESVLSSSSSAWQVAATSDREGWKEPQVASLSLALVPGSSPQAKIPAALSTAQKKTATNKASSGPASGGRATSAPNAEQADSYKPREWGERPKRRSHIHTAQATHVVTTGDTLHHISKSHGIPVRTLQMLNGLDSDSIIHPGMELRIGSPIVQKVSKVERTTNAPTGMQTGMQTLRKFAANVFHSIPHAPATAARAVRVVSAAMVESGRRRPKTSGVVRVQSGDTLADLATKNGVTIRDLQKFNNITSDNIMPGDSLRVEPPPAAVRKPQLRRRTKRHLFEIENDADGAGAGWVGEHSNGRREHLAQRVVKARGWRRWAWRAPAPLRKSTTPPPPTAATDAGARNSKRGSFTVNGSRGMGPGGRKPHWEDRRRPMAFESGCTRRFGNPLPGAFVSSPFGWRWERMHNGVDLAANEGVPIQCAAKGRVEEAMDNNDGYGLILRVSHKGGYETRYAHCSALNVKAGQEVRRGQHVAAVGNTGHSFGAHLHFEVRKNGTPLDPLTVSVI